MNATAPTLRLLTLALGAAFVSAALLTAPTDARAQVKVQDISETFLSDRQQHLNKIQNSPERWWRGELKDNANSPSMLSGARLGGYSPDVPENPLTVSPLFSFEEMMQAEGRPIDTAAYAPDQGIPSAPPAADTAATDFPAQPAAARQDIPLAAAPATTPESAENALTDDATWPEQRQIPSAAPLLHDTEAAETAAPALIDAPLNDAPLSDAPLIDTADTLPAPDVAPIAPPPVDGSADTIIDPADALPAGFVPAQGGLIDTEAAETLPADGSDHSLQP